MWRDDCPVDCAWRFAATRVSPLVYARPILRCAARLNSRAHCEVRGDGQIDEQLAARHLSNTHNFDVVPDLGHVKLQIGCLGS